MTRFLAALVLGALAGCAMPRVQPPAMPAIEDI
jgi:hypothetical protein